MDSSEILETLTEEEERKNPENGWVLTRFNKLACSGGVLALIAIGFLMRFWARDSSKKRIERILKGEEKTIVQKIRELPLERELEALAEHVDIEMIAVGEAIMGLKRGPQPKEEFGAMARHVMRLRDDLESAVLFLETVSWEEAKELRKRLKELDSNVVEIYRDLGASGAWDYESPWMWSVSCEHWWCPPCPPPLSYIDPNEVQDLIAMEGE